VLEISPREAYRGFTVYAISSWGLAKLGGSFGSISLRFPMKVALSHAHRSWWKCYRSKLKFKLKCLNPG